MSRSDSRPGLRVGRVIWALLLVGAAAGAVWASDNGYVERLRDRVWGRPVRLSAGDFPAGISAPDDDVASIPTRSTVIGIVPRGNVGPLVWATGDAERVGLFRAAYAIDVKVQAYDREEDLRKALGKGAENGGVDLAALPVSTLAMAAIPLRDAAPRTVLLLGRSRGQDLLGAINGVTTPAALSGKRIGVEPRSAGHYFALWVLSRAGLSLRDVSLVEIDSSLRAGAALKAGKLDAVAGVVGELASAVKEQGGQVLSSTVDAPNLIATVLVARGDFAARYPDAIRRIIRGTLDANAQVAKEPTEAARALGALVPQLGDPTEAIRAAPPASLKDNLSFFGLSGEAPVTYAEAFQSAAALQQRLVPNTPAAPSADDTADLAPLKYVAAARGP